MNTANVSTFHALVAPVFLRSLLSEAKNNNVHFSSLFRGLELDPTDFELPGMAISRGTAVAVIRRALQLMPASDHGLELGKRSVVTERGALALGMLAADTLGEAISLAVRFPRSAGYLLNLHEEKRAGGHDLIAASFEGDLDLQHFLVDLTFSAKVQLRRQITSARYTPAKVEFVRKPPRHAQAYEAFFGCPVQFGCQRNTLSTLAAWQDFRLPLANRNAFRLAETLLAKEAERFDLMPELGVSVARAIGRSLPKVPDLAQVASSLNLSERTLRRKLAQTGLNFRQLLDESRKAKTFDLMASENPRFAEIAAATGFSDPRAFTRAFKRWTGRPPSQFDTVEANFDRPSFELD